MALTGLTATGDPAGHRIVLTWQAPEPAIATGVRVVRRAGAFPEIAEPATAAAGVVVADVAAGDGRVVDHGLPEGVHYYQAFPYAGSPPVYDEDIGNRVSAAATAPYGFAARLAALLPAVYHRFDAAAAAEPGPLRRFLELPGAELDRIYSDIRSLLDLADVRRIDGRLLPLLAADIGWRTDFRLGLDRQRIEIDQAPALYRTVGTVPAAEAVVRRIAGWPVRTKEYVDNVLVTGRPERRTLWLATPDGGAWTVGEKPLSIDSSPHGRPAVVEAAGEVALVYHAAAGDAHEIRWKRYAGRAWTASEPVVSRGAVDLDPAAARQGDVMWFLWSVYDPGTGGWRIDLRTRGPKGWSPVTTFGGGPAPERRSPAAAVDHEGALWLFWLEEAANDRWQLRHGRFTGTPWAPDPAAGADVPDDGGRPLRPEDGLTVVARPPQAADPAPQFRRIGLLWTRRDPVPDEPGQTRWRVVARFKDGSDPAVAADWGPVVPLPVTDVHDNDVDPAGHVDPDGAVRVLFASTRGGGWSAYGSGLALDPLTWTAVQALSGPPFSERAPVPLSLGGDGRIDAVCLRSNRSITRTGVTYPGTVTVDRRWSGATTVRAGDPAARAAVRGTFEDHLTYVYDTGRRDTDRYARDTVGLFVTVGDDDPPAVAAARERLRRVLPEFVPVTDRAVVVEDRDP